MTDGFSVNLFARKRRSEESVHNVQLSFEDFTDTEVQNHFELVAVDPGRNHVFTAAYGSSNEPHQIRRISTTEYYSLTGSKKRNQSLQIEKNQQGIATVEAQIPTPKTVSMDQYWDRLGVKMEIGQQDYRESDIYLRKDCS